MRALIRKSQFHLVLGASVGTLLVVVLIACQPRHDVWLRPGATVQHAVFEMADERHVWFGESQGIQVTTFEVWQCEPVKPVWRIRYRPPDSASGLPPALRELKYGASLSSSYMVEHAAEPLAPGRCYDVRVDAIPGSASMRFEALADGLLRTLPDPYGGND